MSASEIMEIIDELTDPSKMSKQEAMEVLESIAAQCESRVECLREEMQNERS